MELSHGLGLGPCQAQAEVIRSLVAQRGFIHLGRDCFKRQLQAAEQLTPIAGGGAENQWALKASGNQ